jgi:hypothetical protein
MGTPDVDGALVGASPEAFLPIVELPLTLRARIRMDLIITLLYFLFILAAVF